MNLQVVGQLIQTDLKNFGVAKTLFDLAVRSVNRFIFLKSLRLVKIEEVNPEFLHTEAGYRWQFLSAAQLHALIKNPAHGISESFLRAALEKGDTCYGILDGPILASYGWCSERATAIWDDVTIEVEPDYIYLYKAFTHPKYRGSRLHAIGVNRALREYLGRGYKGFVSYVESNNFSSLKSVYRMGYVDIGRAIVVKLGGGPLVFGGRRRREVEVVVRAARAAGWADTDLPEADLPDGALPDESAELELDRPTASAGST